MARERSLTTGLEKMRRAKCVTAVVRSGTGLFETNRGREKGEEERMDGVNAPGEERSERGVTKIEWFSLRSFVIENRYQLLILYFNENLQSRRVWCVRSAASSLPSSSHPWGR